MDSIWIYQPDKYAHIENESRKYILHPRIAKMIRAENPQLLLDFGCGDGSLVKLLKDDIDVSIYDISSKSVITARENLKSRKVNAFFSVQEIPKSHFDIVVLSLVMMTISNRESIMKELETIHGLLKKNGKIIVAVTHPCFRQYQFSSFHTSYLDDENFNYLNEGKPFTVTIRDPKNNENISFTDFHWSISTTINALIQSNFIIEELIELPDKSFEGSYSNKGKPPYLILRARKNAL